ncbi:hypothetical protein [Brevundimonas sp.]|uniref:hypothetical protein n=1 Tax=Brevundimonas sp. TaxID=1871086 RepID=UPI0028A1F98F|nr:hypothetical protein [Brevundimonas sp.]
MTGSLDIPNFESSTKVWIHHGELKSPYTQSVIVETNRADWFLKEWVIHFDKRQASLVNELGWNKQKASYLWNGKQAYNRDHIKEISEWLGIEPFELLMPPAEALRIRQFRDAAIAIAQAHKPAPTSK